jgi:hypothetical protein
LENPKAFHLHRRGAAQNDLAVIHTNFLISAILTFGGDFLLEIQLKMI